MILKIDYILEEEKFANPYIKVLSTQVKLLKKEKSIDEIVEHLSKVNDNIELIM